MLRKLKLLWGPLLSDPPGERFRRRYERRHKERAAPVAIRVAWSLVALLLVLVGIAAIPLPGPGLLLVLVGVALLAEESLTIAQACDRVERWIRRHLPFRRKVSAKGGR